MAAVTVLIAAGVSLALSSPAGSVAGFGDVPEQSFYTDAVQWMVDNDITTGTSAPCFSPNDAVLGVRLLRSCGAWKTAHRRAS